MRKRLLALAIFIIFCGSILIWMSSIEYEETTLKLVATGEECMEVSADFNKGEKMVVKITPGLDWIQFLEPPVIGVPYPHKFVWINITDPYGNQTWFEISYVPASSTILAIYNITAVECKGLAIENGEGIAMSNGTYTVKVWAYIPPGGKPPSSISIYKSEKIITYPHKFLRFVAALLIALSVGMTFLSLKTKAPQHAYSKCKMRRKPNRNRE